MRYPDRIGVVVGLFLGVLLHELGHSPVAMRCGHRIDAITRSGGIYDWVTNGHPTERRAVLRAVTEREASTRG